MNTIALLIVALLVGFTTDDRGGFALENDARVVFLGDSNTYAGLYVQDIDAYLVTRFPDRTFELINLGLASETVSGLSEPDHPYPRPVLSERLERALKLTKPDVVVASHGMNDGIYYPFDNDRFEAYVKGENNLIQHVQKTHARLFLLSPPPFDAQAVAGKTRPLGAKSYSWVAPFEGYDEVLKREADFISKQRREGVVPIDIHRSMADHLLAVRRDNPDDRLAGDGVHFDARGHWLVAAMILNAWNAPAEVDRAEIDFKTKKVVSGNVNKLAIEKGEIRLEWTVKLPMPLDPNWGESFVAREQIQERLNRCPLIIEGLPEGKWAIFEGDRKLGEATAAEFKKGVNFSRFAAFSPNLAASRVRVLVEKRERTLSPAWLTRVGHKRPDTPKGLRFDDAKKIADELTVEIKRLTKPKPVRLRVEAAD